ncbi:MAG: hypothetical protein HOP23_18825 [Methylococcaceae bacterium]|nr:hypothetical protein [Methylococcaceae bacterium]
MNENTMPSEEEVLLTFAVEPTHDRKTLERYLSEFPEHSIALVDCSIELMLDSTRSNNVVESTEDTVEHAWQRFQAIMSVDDDAPLINPFAKLNSTAFKSLAKRLDITNLLLVRLRDRAIEPMTIPIRFIQKLAAELELTGDAVLVFLNGSPSMISNHSFRSSVKPMVTNQITFQEAIETSQLTDSQKNSLKALED